MKAIYNGQLINSDQIMLSPHNRGFKYGDGLFETLAVFHGKVRLLKQHLERLSDSLQVLRLDKTSNLSSENIKSFIQDLFQENEINIRGKARIYVWRESKGLYSPQNNNINFLITLERDEEGKNTSFTEKAGICNNARNSFSTTSALKTMSALKYVIAGIEKTERGLDDIIIKDLQGNISESISSNIFIKRKGEYFTPPLSTGCINGIMKNWLISEMKKNRITVEEKLFSEEELLEADSIFSSNSSGISHILKVEDIEFSHDPKIDFIIEKLSTD